MMPIWCQKNSYIKFLVEGKWRIDKKYDYTDSKGFKSNNSKGFNYGALIGRIGKKNIDDLDENKKKKEKGKEKKRENFLMDENTFLVANEVTYMVKEEGPLYLRANLPKKLKIEPEGKLEVSIYDADYMDISEINQKIGWIENGTIIVNNNSKNNEKSPSKNKGVTGTSKAQSDKEIEKNIRNNINNLRMNPLMYYEKYISFNTKYYWTKDYLEKVKSEFKDPLQEDEKVYIPLFFKLIIINVIIYILFLIIQIIDLFAEIINKDDDLFLFYYLRFLFFGVSILIQATAVGVIIVFFSILYYIQMMWYLINITITEN